MKKVLVLFCIFLLCSAFQCDDEALEGDFITAEAAACEAAIIDTVEAALEFLEADNDTFTDICAAYKTALQAQIEACGDEDGSLQNIIEQLGDCSVDIDAECQEAILLKNEAEDIFNNSTDTDYTENCNALKEAIQGIIDICGSTQELVDQLEGLGNCIQAINASGQITVTAGTLEIVFDLITVEVVGTTLQVMILLMTNLLFSLLQNFSHILMDLSLLVLISLQIQMVVSKVHFVVTPEMLIMVI